MKKADEIVAYIKEVGSFCDCLELEEHFVEKLKYSKSLIDKVEKNPEIFRYHEDSFIHRDVLEWDDEKQEKFEEVAFLKFYEDIEDDVNYYMLVSELIDLEELPKIGKELIYTYNLLVSLLDKAEHFALLGPLKRAYAPTPNKYGINDFEGVVFTMLQNDHDGEADIKVVSKILREADVIEEDITKKMFAGSQRIKIKGGKIIANLHKGPPRKKL